MTRKRKIFTIAAASLAGLIAILLVAAVIVLQSGWFRNFVREKIVAATEESTGGRVEISSFGFDLWSLRATLNGFVLHGKEQAGAAPLFQARLLEVNMRLFTGFRQVLDLRSVLVDQPHANVIVYPDGSTNVPEPKVKKQSNKPALETVVDLAIGHFELRNGLLAFGDRKLPLDARGDQLRAQLDFNRAAQRYQGRIAVAPLKVQYGSNPPLDITVALPVTVERDRIGFDNATIATPDSSVTLSGAVDHLASPRITAHATARLGLEEMERASGIKPPKNVQGKLPSTATLDASVVMTDERIDVPGANLGLGESTVSASGTLKDPSGAPAGLQFRSRLSLGELGRLFDVASRPQGMVNIDGRATLRGTSEYLVTAEVKGDGLSFEQGQQRFSGIRIASAVRADPKRIALNGIRINALGGELSGSAAIQEMSRFEANAELRDFSIDMLARTFGGKPVGYDGLISGPVKADGNLKEKGTSGIRASAQLGIAPHGKGVPVTGSLNASYNGASDNLAVADSFVSLPHSRLDVAGDLGRELRIRFHSSDLNDFLPAMRASSSEPVESLPAALERGSADFNGTVTGTMSAPQLRGHLGANHFKVEGRSFDQLAADVTASPAGASATNVRLSRAGMQIQADSSVGLRDWKAAPDQALRLNASIRNGAMPDLLALGGQKDIPVTGAVNADVHLSGTVGNPLGTAQAAVTAGVAYEQPFDRIEATLGFTNQRLTISGATIKSPAGNAQLNAAFDHPADSFTTGRLQAQLNTDAVHLDLVRPAARNVNGLAGTAQASVQIAGSLNKVKTESQFLLSAVTADLSVHGLKAEGENYGDLLAKARSSGSTLTYYVDSDLAGSALRVDGHTQLVSDYPTQATLNLQHMPVERLLVLAGRKDIPVRGTMSGTAQVNGTMTNPNASVDLAVANAVIYDEPVNHAAVRATYTDKLIEVPHFEANSGPARIEASAAYAHAPGDLDNGQIKLQMSSSGVSLARIHAIQKYRPGLAGTVELHADGAANVRKQKNGEREVTLAALKANAAVDELAMNRQNLGELKMAAETRGDRLSFNLESNLGGGDIKGHGESTLRTGYPTGAELHFSKLTYSGLRPLLAPDSLLDPLFEISADGEARMNGPATDSNAITASFSLSRLEVATKATATSGVQNVALHNDGPISVSFARSTVKVERARVTGPDTDITLSGTAGLQSGQALDLKLNANTNLALAQKMTRSVYSSGAILVDGTLRGTMAKPLLNGRLELKNASMNYIELPNGLSNANGVILFNGNNATIQSLSAESGGGKLGASGFVSYGGANLGYGLKATAEQVRVRYPPGASLVANAQISLTGTSARSVLGGTVTLQKIGFSPQSDFGSLLASSSQPVQAPSTPTGPLAGMRMRIAIRTAPDVEFQSSLAQNLQGTADLTVRGTPQNPGMLGRVNITQGELVFFGSKYTVSQGVINFFDPTRIRPVLNIDLQTVAKGVTVDLNVAGPIDDLKLTHRSDPPLQFNEIVALLATGRTPTSDPNIVAQQPATPPQSMQQMGESALVSQAIANPVSSRLERVFGVSQLKIDPTFTSGSELPQARLTLQQQITSNLTFTYITNVQQTNSEIIRIEWALNPQWSAIATREETGRFGIDLFYKKAFR